MPLAAAWSARTSDARRSCVLTREAPSPRRTATQTSQLRCALPAHRSSAWLPWPVLELQLSLKYTLPAKEEVQHRWLARHASLQDRRLTRRSSDGAICRCRRDGRRRRQDCARPLRCRWPARPGSARHGRDPPQRAAPSPTWGRSVSRPRDRTRVWARPTPKHGSLTPCGRPTRKATSRRTIRLRAGSPGIRGPSERRRGSSRARAGGASGAPLRRRAAAWPGSSVSLSPSMSCGLTRNALSISSAAPANSESTSAPRRSVRAATYSLATRFMPSRKRSHHHHVRRPEQGDQLGRP